MTTKKQQSSASVACAAARAVKAAVDQELRALAEEVDGLIAVELAAAEGLRQAAERLVEIAERMATEDLLVAGSMGQTRAHPLLSEERALRKEITEQLHKLHYRVEQRASFELVRELTRNPNAGR